MDELRAIPDQPGYFCKADGSIWSNKSGQPRKMAAFRRDRSGHLGVNLTHNGKCRLHSVHRLVAAAWLGLPEGKTIVMHLDDDPANNHASNLAYGTPAENSAQMVERRRQARGERAARSRLTQKQVEEIRERIVSGEKQNRIAARFGVSPTTISDIKKNRIWRT